MEQIFKSLSLFEFQDRFPTTGGLPFIPSEPQVEQWLPLSKMRPWKFMQRCPCGFPNVTGCNYTESPTASTLFEKVKFDLVKAFHIVYFVSANKKGITSTELSRKLNLRQKTCWAFKGKVMKAMESSGHYPIRRNAEVDETVFGGQEENRRGRQNKSKKLVVVGIEKKIKGVSRLYARVIPNASSKELGSFIRAHISPKANITTDQ